MRKLESNGFTLVDLMIATTVFSLVMLIVALSFTQLGKIFYKGISVSRNQETTRSISTRISEAIKFGAGEVIQVPDPTTPNQGKICIGEDHYSYKLGDLTEIGPALRYDADNGGSCGIPASPTDANYVELLPRNTQLLDINIVENGTDRNYSVSLTIGFGDDDLMTNDTTGVILGPEVRCRGGVISSQFCAVSTISTSVTRRVE